MRQQFCTSSLTPHITHCILISDISRTLLLVPSTQPGLMRYDEVIVFYISFSFCATFVVAHCLRGTRATATIRIIESLSPHVGARLDYAAVLLAMGVG